MIEFTFQRDRLLVINIEQVSVIKENKACNEIENDWAENAILHSIIKNFPLMSPRLSKDLQEVREKSSMYLQIEGIVIHRS